MAHFKRFVAILLLCLIPYLAQAAVTATFDRNPVGVGETVTLTFTSNGVAAISPDFTVLEQDFEVQGSSQSNSIQIVNGAANVQTLWQLELAPRKTGTLTVPAIRFGNEQSPSLTLQVVDQPAPNAQNTGDEVVVEVEVEPKQPYVQQQVIVTQRLLHTVNLRPQATLTHPNVSVGKGAVQQLGDVKNTTLLRNGRNYHVIERRYVLMPQQSGELQLGATQFEGSVMDAQTNRYDPFGVGVKPVKRASAPVTLQVMPQPSSYQGKQWLPAKSVSLNAHWQTPPDKLKAGEPATLTLAIMADGLTAEQLPKLDLQAPAGVKAYTDKPELRNDTNSNGVVGVRQENWVVVAPYNGSYRLPAVQLEWWNTKTGQTEVAKLDAVTLTVSGGQAAPTNAQPTPPAMTQPETPQPAASPAAPAQATPAKHWSWQWIAVVLLLCAALAGACWLVWQWAMAEKPAAQSSGTKPVAKPTDAKAVWRELEQACLQHQARAAHHALGRWVEVGLHLQPPTLATLNQQGGAMLRAELETLNKMLYGREGQIWNGAPLLKALQHFKPVTAATSKSSGLVELYPD